MSFSVTRCQNCGENTYSSKPCNNCGVYALGLRDYHDVIINRTRHFTDEEMKTEPCPVCGHPVAVGFGPHRLCASYEQYKADQEARTAATPCFCEECGWQGTYGETNSGNDGPVCPEIGCMGGIAYDRKTAAREAIDKQLNEGGRSGR